MDHIFLASLASFFTFTLFPISIQPQEYDAIHEMNPLCENRCENLRPMGHTDPFQAKCDEKYFSNQAEINECRKNCADCPMAICDLVNPNVYNCPEVDVKDVRKWWSYSCPAGREKGSVDAYIFMCNKAFWHPYTIGECRTDCKFLPRWVCDPLIDNNTYHCPPVLHGTCKLRCENNRKRKFGDNHLDAFQFDCDELYGLEADRCKNSCFKCPENVCKPLFAKVTYNCFALPKPPKPNITTTTTTTSTSTTTTTTEAITNITAPKIKYEGRCQKRCDKFRLGGDGAYTFDCDTLFTPGEELDKCKEDCKNCPDDVCVPYNYSCPGTAVPKMKPKKNSSVPLIVAIIFAAVSTMFFGFMTNLYCKSRNRAQAVALHKRSILEALEGQMKRSSSVRPKSSSRIETTASSSMSNFYTDSGSGLSESASGQSQGQGQQDAEVPEKKPSKKGKKGGRKGRKQISTSE